MVQGLQKYLEIFSVWILDQILKSQCVAIAHTPVSAWNLTFHLIPSHFTSCIPSMLSTTVLR